MQVGKQCFCGNNYGKYGKAKNCKSECPGAKKEINKCGGGWANSVYSIVEHVKQKYKYIGCYKDNKKRDFEKNALSSKFNEKSLCGAKCKIAGFRYFGMQVGKQCFCGNYYGKYGMAKNCNVKCAGNKNQKCGGGWANSVYQVGTQKFFDSHLVFFFPSSFMKMGTSLDIGFAIKKFGDKISDWNGKLYGANYYDKLTMPYSNTALHYVFETNRRDYAGIMRNWSDPTYDTDGKFVYWDMKQKKYVIFYDETGLKGEKTYIKGILPKNLDDPTEDNILLSGLVELSTNGELWRLERAKKASTHTIEIFKLIDSDGTDLIKITHTMFAPKNNRNAKKYITKSQISVKICYKLAGQPNRYMTKTTKWFNFTKFPDHILKYEFQFWTETQPGHYLRKKPLNDMELNFLDNRGNKIHVKTTSKLWINSKPRDVLLGHTFEDMDYIIKPYNHKWITFVGTLASHNYMLDQVCDSKAKFCNNILGAPTMCSFKHAMVFNEESKLGICSRIKNAYTKCWKNEKG